MTREGSEAAWSSKKGRPGGQESVITFRSGQSAGASGFGLAITPPAVSGHKSLAIPKAGHKEDSDEMEQQLPDVALRVEPLGEEIYDPGAMRWSWRRSLLFIILASGGLWAAIVFGVVAVLS